MTYCLALRLKEGIVAIADTRITSGTETTTAKKVYVHQAKKQSMFLMTSGLRSVRDKALTYFREVVEQDSEQFSKLYQAVNEFGKQLKRVAQEDRESLERAGLAFNLHTIVGGQFQDDKESKVYMLYPEGNWIEISQASPFVIIGNSGYGKPVLNRTITFNSSLKFALKTGFLSFDSTRVSANDVGFPLDVLIYRENSYQFIENRYEEHELDNVSEFWGNRLEEAVKAIPDDWTDKALNGAH